MKEKEFLSAISGSTQEHPYYPRTVAEEETAKSLADRGEVAFRYVLFPVSGIVRLCVWEKPCTQ